MRDNKRAASRTVALSRHFRVHACASVRSAVTEMEIQGKGPREYYSIKEAITMGGVRWSGYPECPAPISEPLKQMLWIKCIPAARVAHSSTVLPLGDPENSAALVASTAQSSWPVLWYNDERPRTTWLEQLELVERLGKSDTAQLFPSDPASRSLRLLLESNQCYKDKQVSRG
jgi:hypothetical protein